MDLRKPTLGCMNDIKKRWVPEKTWGSQLGSILGSKKNGGSVQERTPSFHTWEEKQE